MTGAATLAQFVARASELAVITGAGVSTGSGIGDYRDRNGEWKRPAPVQHKDFVSSLYWRRRYWVRSQLGYPEFSKAQPNEAHIALADWERSGKVVGLITQNVDRLHQKAGHENVVDLHGRLDRVVCLDCGARFSRNAIQDWLATENPRFRQIEFERAPDGDADLELGDVADVQVPSCLECGGILKPDVVFYGASVPREVVDRAMAIVDAADAVLVVGSSLMVYSSFRFVRHAHANGKPLAAVNLGRTRADDLFDLKVEADCCATLARLRATAAI